MSSLLCEEADPEKGELIQQNNEKIVTVHYKAIRKDEKDLQMRDPCCSTQTHTCIKIIVHNTLVRRISCSQLTLDKTTDDN